MSACMSCQRYRPTHPSYTSPQGPALVTAPSHFTGIDGVNAMLGSYPQGDMYISTCQTGGPLHLT